MGSRKTIRSKAEGRNIRNRTEDSRGMRSHSRAIHSSKAIPRIIRNRGMANSKDTLNKDIPNKLIRNKAIPNKDTPNSNTTSNRVMDNHNRQILPGMTRPKKRRP